MLFIKNRRVIDIMKVTDYSAFVLLDKEKVYRWVHASAIYWQSSD